MPKQNAKARAKAVEKAKGLEEAQRWPCKGWLAGKQRHEKRKEQVLEQMPGPAVEEDPEIAELQEELASQLLGHERGRWSKP